MIIGGLVKFSLNDYPGKTSAVIFTRSCNLRCPYCHNPELVLPQSYAGETALGEVFDFLKSRTGKLDAVTVTGGEPTQHPDLRKIIREIKNMGYLVKLDSNGTRPEILEEVMGEGDIDYIAMDVKAPFEKYEALSRTRLDTKKIKKSIEIIISSGLPHEFRTTVVKELITFDDLREIAQSIKGAQNYFLQRFAPAPKLNDLSFLSASSYPEADLLSLASELAPAIVKHCSVR